MFLISTTLELWLWIQKQLANKNLILRYSICGFPETLWQKASTGVLTRHNAAYWEVKERKQKRQFPLDGIASSGKVNPEDVLRKHWQASCSAWQPWTAQRPRGKEEVDDVVSRVREKEREKDRDGGTRCQSIGISTAANKNTNKAEQAARPSMCC